MASFVTEKLASWAIDQKSEELPEPALERAVDCVLDAISCAIAGRLNPAAESAKTVAQATFGQGEATIWFSSTKLNPVGSAFANAAMASALDIDDGHRRANGHPGAAVVPAALACCDQDTRGIDLLASIIAGYEVCVRGGMSENHKSYHSGNFTALGAAVVKARSDGLNAEQLMHGLATVIYHGPRVADLTNSCDMGSNVKESIPWSVITGMVASDLAGQGFAGCRDAMDSTERYNPSLSLEGLDQGYFPKVSGGDGVSHAILRNYFKRYACCRWCHSAIEGLLHIMREYQLAPQDIRHVKVETFLQSARLNNLADPPSLESAQYSVPFCMAVAAVLGEKALSPMVADVLSVPSVVRIAELITVTHDSSLDPMFPDQNPSRVIVTTASHEFKEFVASPWGEPDDPPSRVELIDKFHNLADGQISNQQTDAIISGINSLRRGTVAPLLNALQSQPIQTAG
ncbi:hypothetical protein AB838_02135 [Rhodobacteraceae bacterium (ex Bugula neritina AB1)]|nr:hypothetical protein AB838_02135 [Rhodobacteraceae bacterium (ex Bugula neritina AB1)]